MADNKEHDFESLSEIDRLKENNPNNVPDNSDSRLSDNEPHFGDLDNIDIDDADPSFGDLSDINIDDNIPSFADQPPMSDEELSSYASLMDYQNYEDEFEHDISGFEFDGGVPYQPPYSEAPQHTQDQPELVQEETPAEHQSLPEQEEAPVEVQPEDAQEEATVEPQPESAQEEATVEPQPEPAQEEATVEPQPEPALEEATVEPQPEPVQEETNLADISASVPAAEKSTDSENNGGVKPETQKEESEIENNKMSENKSFADFSEENAALDSYVNEVINNKFDNLTRDELKSLGQYKDGEVRQMTIDYLKTKKAMENSNGFDVLGFEELHAYQMAELYLKEIESKKEHQERLDKLLQTTILNNKEAFEDPDLDEDKAIHVFKRIFETVQMSDDFKDVRDAVDNKVKSQDIASDLEAAGFDSDQISKLLGIDNAEYSLKLAKAYSTEIEGEEPSKFSEMLKGAKGSILGFMQNPNTGLALSSLAFTSALATGGALPLAIAGARLASKMVDHPQVSGMFSSLGDKIIQAAEKVGVDAKPAVGMFKKAAGKLSSFVKSKYFVAGSIVLGLGAGAAAYNMSDTVQEIVDNKIDSVGDYISDNYYESPQVDKADLSGDNISDLPEATSENSVESLKETPENSGESTVNAEDSSKDTPEKTEETTLSAEALALKDKLVSAKEIVNNAINHNLQLSQASFNGLGITNADLSALKVSNGDLLAMLKNPEELSDLFESKIAGLNAQIPDDSVTDSVSGVSVDDSVTDSVSGASADDTVDSASDKPDEVVPVAPDFVEVTVAKGDTAWSLAAKHLTEQLGEAPTDRQITALINDLGMDDPGSIQPGEVIKFPSDDLTQYEAENITKVERQAWQKDVGKIDADNVDVVYEEVTKDQVASVDNNAVLNEVASTVPGTSLFDFYEKPILDMINKDPDGFSKANPEFIQKLIIAESDNDLYALLEPGMEFHDGNGGIVTLPSLEDAVTTMAFGDNVPAYLDKSALIEQIDAANPNVDFDQRHKFDFIGVTGNANVISDSANGIENFNFNAIDTNFTATNTEFNVSHSMNGVNNHGLETRVLEAMYDGNIPELLDRKAVINDLASSNPQLKEALASNERGYVSIDVKVPISMGLNPISEIPQELAEFRGEAPSNSNINQNYLDELRERNKGSDFTI